MLVVVVIATTSVVVIGCLRWRRHGNVLAMDQGLLEEVEVLVVDGVWAWKLRLERENKVDVLINASVVDSEVI